MLSFWYDGTVLLMQKKIVEKVITTKKTKNDKNISIDRFVE